jgi:predicted nuclease of predicted toxin-antitoxin system
MMHPLHFPIIADENIHDEIVHFLRGQSLIIESIKERDLRGSTDEQIIALAEKENKIILTHDADFGRIMHLSQIIHTGIIFLRPGHIDFNFTIQTLKAIFATELEVQIPFILVAERSGEDIKIRLRKL